MAVQGTFAHRTADFTGLMRLPAGQAQPTATADFDADAHQDVVANDRGADAILVAPGGGS